jgi:hypothetical protein
MEETHLIEIHLTGEDVEKIVFDHIEKRMLELGYRFSHSKNEEGPFPDVRFTGGRIKAVEDK